MTGVYDNTTSRLVYGVFTTPANSVGGAAVCAFRLDDILASFAGSFKEQETANSNWLPVREAKVPDGPRPGSCSTDSQRLSESSLRFVQDHSIMDQAVPSFFGEEPIFIRANVGG